MAELTGTVIIAQKGRLRLIGDPGSGQRFIASPKAVAEQPPPGRHGQFRVRAAYTTSPNAITVLHEPPELDTRGSA
jgi:hypothetical protein